MMKSRTTPQNELHFLQGGGEMGALIRKYDWNTTSLGHPQTWPKSLQTSIGIMLGSPYPMFVWWGKEMIMFHNDAYVPVLGKRHPEALGKSGPVIWKDVWEFIGPLMYDVLDNGKACYFERQLLIPERKGFKEETYFTFSYSPIPDDHSGVGGVFCVCSEDTKQVLNQRRLTILSQLSEVTASENIKEVFEKSADILNGNLNDIPFGLFYKLTDDGKTATMEGAFGINSGAPASPHRLRLDGNEQQAWPLPGANSATANPIMVNKIHERFSSLPTGPWEEPPTNAIVIPLYKSGQSQLVGYFIAAISPRLEFDEDYQRFLSLVAVQVSTAIANVTAHEEERMRTRKLLDLDKAKTDFFSNVSHEFRTPLTLMLGPLEQTMSENNTSLSKEDREQLATVYKNALRLLKLVNTLLDFSRIEAIRTEVSFQPTDLSSYTKGLANIFESAILNAGLNYEVSCPALSVPIYIDPGMWEAIVLNLITNALKFTFEGTISVRLQEAEKEVKLTVQDTGVGIPQEELPNLFKRFQRVRNTRSRSHEGAGIGLALVKELVEIHGGTIDVSSIEGKGTSFTVSIQKGTDHLSKERINARKAAPATGKRKELFLNEALLWDDNRDFDREIKNNDQVAAVPGPGIEKDKRSHVLIVDDNADMLHYLSRILGAYWSIETAKDGQAALGAIRRDIPDLVISDVMMPNMDGFTLLSEIRKDSKISHIPVILLSARAGEEAIVAGLEKGANDYLVKPFSSQELLARVRTQLELNNTKRLAARLEKLVSEKTQELQRSNEELQQFAHVASHDLKEPIRKISIFIGRLQDDPETIFSETGKYLISRVNQAADRMRMLIEEILNYSTVNSLKDSFQPVDLNKVLKDVETDLEIVIQRKEASIKRGELPVIEGIPILLHQLFYNLIQNALKFSKEGIAPIISLSSKMVNLEGKEFEEITLHDNGIGFRQEQSERIFETFSRLVTRDKYEGTGLGLALCKRIAEKHGGTIKADGKEGEGATFYIYIPSHQQKV